MFSVSWNDLDSTLFVSQIIDDMLTFSLVWILTPSLTFPILPAPSVFCNCQSPTILYLDLLLGAPFDDADGADDLEA
jgi:hypothetical protein